MKSHLSIKIDGHELALKPGQSIDIEDRNPLFNDTEMFSFPIEVPFIKNRHLLKNLDAIGSDMRPVEMEHRKAQIFSEGLPLRSGVTVVQEEEVIKDAISVNIDASTRSFDNLIANLKCQDIPVKDKLQIGEKIGNVNVSVTYEYKVEMDIGKKDWVRETGTIGPVTGTFQPQALGFSYPGICQESASFAAEKGGQRDYPGGKTVVVPKVLKSFINVSSEYGSNVNSPYTDANGNTIPWPFCNARICYKHYALDESDNQKTGDKMVLPKDGKWAYEDFGPYWVLDADRQQSGICFYVLYFLDCLFAHLGVSFDKTELLKIKDFSHLCFFTTHCRYDVEPTGKTMQGFEQINNWMASRGSGGYLSVDDPDVKSLDEFDFFMAGEYSVGKDDVRQIKSSAKITQKEISAEVMAMYANSYNFPDESVSKVIKSLESAFGIRFYYDYECNRVTAYLLRSVFRSQKPPVELKGRVLQVHPISEKITGVRMKYAAEGTAKEQADYIRRQKRDYDTDFDYVEYPEGRTVMDKSYSDIFRNISANDMKVYVDKATGNAYRIKVSSDATTASELRPVLYEVGALKGVEIGDCSDENEDFVREYIIDFQPIMFNDVNYYRELLAAQGSVRVQTTRGETEIMVKSNTQPILAAFIDEEMEHEFVKQKINNVITNALVDIYLTENLELVESYDPSNTDDGNSPLQEYDWGLAVAMMRGGGTNMEIQEYDYDYDGMGNSKWRTVAGLYALTMDSIDNVGNEYDYNGTQEGIGPGERFSLKICSYKPFRYKGEGTNIRISTDPREWANDPTWLIPCNADVYNSQTGELETKIMSRGLYDTFMSELTRFLLFRKRVEITFETTVAQLADIPNHWLDRFIIGGMVGYINKVSYQLSVDRQLAAVTVDFFYI